jgi:hypothetical protein
VIQPLRTLHRRAAYTLAVALPAVFIAGLAARKGPAPPNGAAMWRLTPPAEVSWRPAAVVRLASTQATVRRSDDSKWIEIRTPQPLAPDVLVYWSPAGAPGSELPPGSRLLGTLAEGPVATPASAGYALLYSLPHQNIIGSIRLEGLP